jgi:L-ascorbate metabolism protein UlaG (beta-lactamase superfamily)
MGDRGAAAAARDLRPKTVIPIHLGIAPHSLLLSTAHTSTHQISNAFDSEKTLGMAPRRVLRLRALGNEEESSGSQGYGGDEAA